MHLIRFYLFDGQEKIYVKSTYSSCFLLTRNSDLYTNSHSEFAQCILLWNFIYLSNLSGKLNIFATIYPLKTRNCVEKSFVKYGKKIENSFLCKQQKINYRFVSSNNMNYFHKLSLLFIHHSKLYLKLDLYWKCEKFTTTTTRTTRENGQIVIRKAHLSFLLRLAKTKIYNLSVP